MKVFLLSIFTSLILNGVYAQLNPIFTFQNGIYVTQKGLKNNQPDYDLSQANIDINKNGKRKSLLGIKVFDLQNRADFKTQNKYLNTLNIKEIQIQTQDSTFILNQKQILALCLDGLFYINYNKEFVKVPIQGSICHFALESTKAIQAQNLSQDNNAKYSTKLKYWAQQKVLYVPKGKIYDFTPDEMAEIFQDDAELFKRFSKESKKKKKEKLFNYLLEFNLRNPI